LTALFLAAKVAITLTLFWLIARNVSFSELTAVFARSDARFATVGIATLALQPIIGALRWLTIARRVGAHISMGNALAVTYAGTFFNQALPATVGGDALRIWLLHRRGMSLQSSVTSVGLDRVCMLVALVLAVAVGAALASQSEVAELHLAALAFLIAAVGGIAAVVASETLPQSWQRWRLVRAIAALSADTRRVLFSPAIALAVLAISLAGVANMSASIYFFSQASGHPLELTDAMMLIPPVILVSTLPISIGGWGAREFAMVAALATVGIPSSAALAVSIMFGVSSILVSLPGAPCYLFLKRQ
jgi:uncharacterized protein (TIRG00374 family)